MNEWMPIVSLAGLLTLSAFFSSSETALFSLSRIEKSRLLKARPRAYRWVAFHLEHPRRVLGTILLGNLFVNTLATAIATLLALKWYGPAGVAPVLGVFTLMLILFGEIFPKILAVRQNESVAIINSIPLAVFSWILTPALRLIRWVSDWILGHMIKDKPISVETISGEELQAMVKVGEEEGILDRQERKMIQKIFEMGARPVREIMTPRVRVYGLDVEDPVEKHFELIRMHHHTRFPVCKGSLDNILGVISVQDYVLSPTRDLAGLIKQPLFVPEAKRVDDLLAEFRSKKIGFAVCVDEFGGTAGIVTLEDILEEVFGEFYDEYAVVENPVRPYGYNEYLVEAKMTLADLNEQFHLKLESEEATTLGGLVLERLGEVPEKGRELALPGCEVRVHEVIRQRYIRSAILKVLA